jgi:hypothetical protein
MIQETHNKMLTKTICSLKSLITIASTIPPLKSKFRKEELDAIYNEVEPKVMKLLQERGCPIDTRFREILKYTKKNGLAVHAQLFRA